MMRWLTAACAAALLLALVGTAHAAQTLRVAKAQAYAFAFIPLDIGIALGLFEKHGLAIEASQLDGSGKMHQAMAAKSIERRGDRALTMAARSRDAASCPASSR